MGIFSFLQVQVITSEYTDSYRRAELRCESSCQAGHQSYTWIKNGREILRETSSSLSVSVLPADRYSCALKGYEEFPSPAVYAPQLPSVSVSPSDEIVEGISVTLTCSSDANPAASYSWYKDDITNSPSNNSQLVFSSIQSSDSGWFICMATNQLGWKWSKFQHLDVKYAPQRPSVSVSPPDEIVEGSSVTLTCSSDANPAASYSWYKEDEEFPTASGQNFTITDVRPEHSGRYSCEAQNNRGSQSSTVHLIVVRDASEKIMNCIRLTLVVLMPVSLLLLFLWMRRKRSSDTGAAPERMQPDPVYQNISALKAAASQTEKAEEQDDPL
ncbi:B-cell receptor CD22-like [Fundulus diaphanus]